MFFFYSGSEPLSVLVPNEQYAFTINPSDRSQHTSNEVLYEYLFSDGFEHRALFEKTEDFEPPAKKASSFPGPRGKEKSTVLEAKTDGGSE